MPDILTLLLEDIIDILVRMIESEEQRRDIYGELLQAFEEAEIKDFTPVLGFDPLFDEVYFERYPEKVFDEE